jgi:hypothetical protein
MVRVQALIGAALMVGATGSYGGHPNPETQGGPLATASRKLNPSSR